MGYDYVSNTMYAPAYQYSGVSGLYTVDLTSGAFTLVGLQNSNELDGLAIPYSSSKTLNLSSIFLEGFYTGLSTMMQATQRFPDGSFGPYWADGSADHISVELHTPGDYATVIYTAPDVPLSTTGTATVTVPAMYNASYYLTIKQRNHLETVSALPLSFAGATITYAFDAFTKAYDGNMTQMLEADGETMSPPLIFGGDVNQDAQIESDDINAVGNDAAAYVLGFTATDIVPDAQVESADINIVGNNAALYVFAHLPM